MSRQTALQELVARREQLLSYLSDDMQAVAVVMSRHLFWSGAAYRPTDCLKIAVAMLLEESRS